MRNPSGEAAKHEPVEMASSELSRGVATAPPLTTSPTVWARMASSLTRVTTCGTPACAMAPGAATPGGNKPGGTAMPGGTPAGTPFGNIATDPGGMAVDTGVDAATA